MPTFLSKVGRGVAAMVLVSGVVSAVSAVSATPAAAAVTCGPSAPDRESGKSQVIHEDPDYPLGVAIRTGPGTNCLILARVPWSAWVDLNCYRAGDGVNGIYSWSAVHYAQYFGWISNYYLTGHGADYAC
jgi:hypothetical protein